MVVSSKLPARTVQDFVRYARERQGKLNFGSAGIGNTTHLAAEMFCLAAGLDMTHVPYNGSAPALLALARGDVQVMFDTISSSIGMIRDGQLRALAVTTAQRVPALEGVPTIAESGVPGFEAQTWTGVAIRRATPGAEAGRLHSALDTVQADPEFQRRVASLGLLPQKPLSPDDIAHYLTADRERWASVIRTRNISLD